MAHSANPNPVPKLYKSIIEDVMESVREIFVEEGVDEQVLKELKQLWETKLLQSKATEGFFQDNSTPQFVLQLPQNLHHSLHTSTGNRNVTHFATGEMGTSGSNSAFSLPAGITYPIHLPAGMTVQTASGQLYKVTVPVMVTQAPGGPRILQPPVQQFFQHVRQPLGPSSSSQYSRNTYIEQKWQQQPANVHSSEGLNIYDREASVEPNYQNNNDDLLIQQSVDLQDHLTNKVLNQPTHGLEDSHLNDITGPLFSPRQMNGGLDLSSESVMNNLNMAHSMQGQPEHEYSSLLKPQDSDDVVELILMDNELGDKNSAGDNGNIDIPNGLPGVEKQAVPREIEIIQVDGAGDTSSDEDLGNVRDLDENEFLGIIDTEDLKALEEDDTGSNEDSTSNSSDDEDPEIDVIEEDPLNSGDDVSEQEVPDLFDTDNVIVCQYDKIHRSKNKWKFYLKDGVMSFGGKDYVFSKAIGEAEW
ncbi:TFIIA-alpha and beta-like factor [Xenopus laevis]|uniref:ALF protein n=1 Tax=Xenopus laevis TaxID=8355 RepID=Q6GMZ8_XENLA|nr:TFIIA-alpha and beta-like factor [Xenopus laevis]AAH73725.1 ALF protein [Xenopus laevis]